MVTGLIKSFAKAVWNMEPSKAFFTGATIGALSAAVITLGILENEKKHESLIKIFSTAVSAGCGLYCIARGNQRDRERVAYLDTIKDESKKREEDLRLAESLVLKIDRRKGIGLPHIVTDNTKGPEHS